MLKEESAEEPFIVELRPDLDEAVNRLMRRLELGERKGLEAEFKALLRANPNDHLTNYAMGVCQAVVEQDPVGAIPFFEKAIRVFPPFVEAHFNLGNSYLKACRIAEAVGAYRKAIRHSDGEDGIDEKAREELRALERIIQRTSPFSNLDAYLENAKLFDLAFERLKSRHYEKAVELFSRVLEQYPGHVQSYGNLGLAYAGLGRKAAALECLDKALEIDPSYAPAHTNRIAIAEMNEGEPQIPLAMAETEYYRERLEAQRRQATAS
jgi:tetratricopeptide (TPR) repeat protein